jgi:acrylyl-CoA reductase (NADPH)
MCPNALRRTAWRRLASDLDRSKLAEMTTEIGLAQVLHEAPKILEGHVRGRTLIKIAG